VKIFAYEHITGGGCAGAPLPGAMLHEATAMLRALAADLNAIAGPPSRRAHARATTHRPFSTGVVVTGLFDQRVVPLIADHGRVHALEEWQVQFDERVRGSDAVWLIAPEPERILENLSDRVLSAGATLLGSRPQAVRVAASKRSTAWALHAVGIPALPALGLEELSRSEAAAWIAKPDDGCGCEDTWLFDRMQGAADWVSLQPDPTRFVLQPYVDGQPLSLSVLARGGEAWLLSVNRQRIEKCAPPPRPPSRRPGEGWGQLHHTGRPLAFRGCLVNALSDSDGAFQRLAQRVVDAIPGLWGYFGIDLILTPTGPMVVEVNPRLTTSYVGLSAALGTNVAGLVLGLLSSDAAPELPGVGAPTRAVEVAVS
jgi:predicted ATP-grasp superfamily ATP-dependent carboligase